MHVCPDTFVVKITISFRIRSPDEQWISGLLFNARAFCARFRSLFLHCVIRPDIQPTAFARGKAKFCRVYRDGSMRQW
eukprot:191251-Pyramimonas_sp.AAC.1